MITVYGIDDPPEQVPAQMSDVIHRCIISVADAARQARASFCARWSDNLYIYISGGRSDKYTVIKSI